MELFDQVELLAHELVRVVLEKLGVPVIEGEQRQHHLPEELAQLRLEQRVGELVLDGLLDVLQAIGRDASGQHEAGVAAAEEGEARREAARRQVVLEVAREPHHLVGERALELARRVAVALQQPVEDGDDALLDLEGRPLDGVLVVVGAAVGQRLLEQREHRLEPRPQVGRLQQPRRQAELRARPHDLADEQADLGAVDGGRLGEHLLREVEERAEDGLGDAVQRLAQLVALELVRLAQHSQRVERTIEVGHLGRGEAAADGLQQRRPARRIVGGRDRA